MMIAIRSLTLLAASIGLLSPAHSALQGRMADECETEIHTAEVRIAAARKKPEYRSEQGRQSLSTADRWLNQARRHAAKGESRNCITTAKKGRAQVSAR